MDRVQGGHQRDQTQDPDNRQAASEEKGIQDLATKADIIKEQVQKMLSDGVIEPSTSAWASPVVLVPRKDQTFRLCVNYRGLNTKKTRRRA